MQGIRRYSDYVSSLNNKDKLLLGDEITISVGLGNIPRLECRACVILIYEGREEGRKHKRAGAEYSG